MESTPKIVALRKHLAEKMPHIRLFQPEAPEKIASRWATGLAQIDDLLHGGLPKAAITEILCPQAGRGGGMLISALMEQARRNGQWTGLIDGADSFDPAGVSPDCHARLLWARCANAAQALQATDILLRDGNLPVVVLDLGINSLLELRKISSAVWHRFQRLLEANSTSLIALAPVSIVSRAQVRLELTGKFSLEALTQSRSELTAQLQFELRREQRGAGENPLLARTA
jgi:hypothetical protein